MKRLSKIFCVAIMVNSGVLVFCDTQKAIHHWVIVKKSSPKNLSADSRPTVGRQLANSRPTGFAWNIGYLSADSRPTVGNVSVTCR